MKVLIYDMGCAGGDIRYPIKEAFETLGHQVSMFDWQNYMYSASAPGLVSRVKDRFFFCRVAKRINSALMGFIEAGGYDFMLVSRGDHIFPETILKAKAYIPVIVNWSTDDVFNTLQSTKYLRDSFDKYDCIFSPRGHLREEYLSRGAKSFEVLDWYYRLGLLYPAPDPAPVKYEHEIAFVGSWSPRREKILAALEGLNVSVFGWGWNKKTPRNFFARERCRPFIDMKGMHDVFASTMINLNILTIENRDTTNLRNFEIPAAGGFQLSERSREIGKLFREDQEIVCFGDNDELRNKCEYYLANKQKRQNIALAGYHRLVSGNHSIVDRVKQITDKVEAMMKRCP